MRPTRFGPGDSAVWAVLGLSAYAFLSPALAPDPQTAPPALRSLLGGLVSLCLLLACGDTLGLGVTQVRSEEEPWHRCDGTFRGL